jgi:hypothetical protein
MSSSNSSEMDDQIAMAFSGVMDEAMSILQAEEATAAIDSSSIQLLKCHRHHVNLEVVASHDRWT